MTAAENREADWTLADQIAAGLRASSDAYQAALAEFQKDLAISPSRAIGSKSDGMIQAETTHKFWLRASRLVARDDADDAAEGIALLLKETETKVRQFFDSNSPNLFLNAVERSRAVAYVSLINYAIPVLRRFVDSNK